MEEAAVRWSVATPDALAAFYDASIGAAYRYAAKLTGNRASAEDLVQDAYLALVGAARRRAVSDVSVAWLTTTIRNRHIDRLRRGGREAVRLRLVGVTDEAVSVDELPGSVVDVLPARERAALVLRYVDDLSVPEVARQLGMSVHATESLLARARARARKEANDA
jgi:RNA polymerase sigma-70 factor (ECF subfamily)